MHLRLNLIALVFLLAPAACHQIEQTDQPPNIVLISIDTLRQDHLGCYNYQRPTSPNIDELALRGVIYDNAVSTSSWTLPVHTSMLTGRYPSFHGLQDEGMKLAPGIPTLAESLKECGYQTVAVVSHIYVSAAFGLERGFDRFDETLILGGAYNPAAGQVVDQSLGLISALPQGPFFAFVHFFDPHTDYTPPPPFVNRLTRPTN
jgi:choline-sulfatase